MKVIMSMDNFSRAPKMNVGPNALHSGVRTEATFFFRLLLKSTCPDALRNDAFAV